MTFFSHRPLESDDLFSRLLFTTPIFPRRLSSVLSKFSHKNFILFGCHPLDGITRGGPLHLVTPPVWIRQISTCNFIFEVLKTF